MNGNKRKLTMNGDQNLVRMSRQTVNKGQQLFPSTKLTRCQSISLNIVGNPLLSVRS